MVFVKIWAFLPLMVFSISIQAPAYDGINVFKENHSRFKVLVFLSRSCPCSQSHVEHLNILNKKYKEVSFFAVITDVFDEDSKDEIDQYYRKSQFHFPVIKDESQVLIKEYKALKTPHAVLLQKKSAGQYAVIFEGGVTNRRDFVGSTQKYLSANLEAVTQDKPLVYTAGKSLGCYIRRL